jgi:hypothetical protein
MASSLVPSTRKLRTLGGYSIMLAATVGVYLAIRGRGEELVAPEPVTAAVGARGGAQQHAGDGAAGAGGDHHAGAGARLGVPALPAAAAGDRGDRRGAGARAVGARGARAGGLRGAAADRGGAVPRHRLEGRGRAVHVPGRARARHEAACVATRTRRWPSRTRASSRRSCSGRRSRSGSTRCTRARRQLHGVLAVPRGVAVGHGVPGAGAHPHRPAGLRARRSGSPR